MRRSKSIETLLPWLYLKGISTGDFSEALQAILGPDAPGFRHHDHPAEGGWEEEFAAWNKRAVGQALRLLWADGVHLNIAWRTKGSASWC